MIREYIIKISDEIMEEEIADRPQELVRCKDCKYGEEAINANGERMIKCMGEFPDWLRYPDWFCADAERKESDAD